LFARSAIGIAALTLVAAPCAAAVELVQVTDDQTGSGCISTAPVVDDTGTIFVWQSTCNPAASNADASTEIFRATLGANPVQLTTGAACTSSHPTVSSDGSRVAFESTCNPKGTNGDGNVEIFLWRNGNLTQLTATTDCDNLAPSISGNGTYVAFDSTCGLSGTNVDGHGSEIFRVSDKGVLEQLTADPDGDCDSTSASINRNGSVVAFDSDCDLTGQNENLAIEIFTVTAAGAVTQRTFAEDEACSSVRPAIDALAKIVGFQSDCDFAGGNADGNDEIFTVKTNGELRQVTSSPAGTACASGEVHMAPSGNAVSFSSYCRFGPVNADESIEAFQAGVGSSPGGLLALTSGANCASLAGGLSNEGTRVALDSDCDLTGDNSDESVEVFRAVACVCGAPNTRKTTNTSDALLVLRAAVGITACALCECDVNNDGVVNTADALRTLRAAVGQPLALTCPAG
jgi:hypothetical protein